MAHSKRNTSLAFFTSHERAQLKTHWGTQSTHLTRESFLPFGSCQLCLLPAVSPMACSTSGHLFCRECVLENLIAQRKEIARLERLDAEREREKADEEQRAEEAADRENVRRFEEVQRGGDGASHNVNRKDDSASKPESSTADHPRATKRKFALDDNELERIALADRKAARHSLTDTPNAQQPASSFWLPSQLPTASSDTSQTTQKRTPTCPSANPASPHGFSLKTLVPVNFHIISPTVSASTTTTPSASSNTPSAADPSRTCPACLRTLTNASKPVMAVPCGHVLCKGCAGKFMNKERKIAAHETDVKEGEVRCYVCEADLSGKKEKRKKEGKKEKEKIRPGLVEMDTEGTGFAGGGKSFIKKEGVVFQC